MSPDVARVVVTFAFCGILFYGIDWVLTRMHERFLRNDLLRAKEEIEALQPGICAECSLYRYGTRNMGMDLDPPGPHRCPEARPDPRRPS